MDNLLDPNGGLADHDTPISAGSLDDAYRESRMCAESSGVLR